MTRTEPDAVVNVVSRTFVLAVAADGLERLDGLELEAAAALGVEDPVEHRLSVEARQAEPIDRAVATDERRGVPVADQGVVGNGR